MYPLGFSGTQFFPSGRNVALKNVFSALLLSAEASSLSVLKKVLEDYGINTQSAGDVADLSQMLRRRRFDIAVLDNDLAQAAPDSCELPSRWNGMVIVLHSRGPIAFDRKRIHLIIPKPVTPGLLSRGLKALYTTMARQRLATYRHQVGVKLAYARLFYHGIPESMDRAIVVNISQTGLCLSAPKTLPAGSVVSASVPLPDGKEPVNISGTVVWSDPSGLSGIKFHRLPGFEQKKLQDHLNPRLPWRFDSLLAMD
jgi:PilZ domain